MSGTGELLRTNSFEAAKAHLVENMTGELAESPDLYGVLGWLYSNQEPLARYAALAQGAFETSHRLGARKADTYFHWAQLERKLAESTVAKAQESDVSDDAIAKQWKKCEGVAEMGIERCGQSQPLCYLAGYGASREAKAKSRTGNFTYAQGAYTRAIDWLNKALTSPTYDGAPISKGPVYRGLTLAYEGLRDEVKLLHTLKSWHRSSGSDPYFETECRRLLQIFPNLQNVSEFRYLLAPMSWN